MSRDRWSLVAAYAALSGSNQLLWLTFAPLTTEAARHYGVSTEAIGWLSEIFPLLYVVLAIPAGLALDRWLRPALGVGIALNGLGALIRIEGSYPGVLVGQLLIAAAQPLILAAVTKVVDQAVDPPARPRAIGLASAGLFAGMLVALAMGPIFGEAHLEALVLTQGVIGAAASVALAAALIRPGWRTAGERRPEAPIRSVLGQPSLRLLIIIAACGFGVFVAMTTWLQALLVPAGVSTNAAGVMLLIFVAAGIIGGATLPAPLINRNLGGQALTAAAAITVISCLLLAVAPGTVTGLVASALIGLVLLTALPVILTMVEQRAGDAGGTATGLVWLAGNAGGIVVALAVQSALDRPSVSFVIMAVVMALGLPVARRLVRSEKAATAIR